VRKLDRREFVIGAGGAALAGAVSPAKVFAQAAAPQQIVLRRPIGSMQPDDPAIVAYRLAVERMKALPPTDPRSWTRMAQIHIDFCPHSNWFFLPWHRAYLVMFEGICRQVIGDPTFALPYWDWTEQRQLPPAFTEATVGGRRNSLFDNTRDIRPADSIPSPAVAQDAILRIMAETNFENFGSTRPVGQNSTEARWLRATGTMTPLEGGPHGTVHVTVGGDMSDMGSPLDPIFWLHHCNIDRLWAWWNALGRRNTTNRLWRTFPFNGIFQTPQGEGLTAWNVSVSDMLDHGAFGYTYPDLPGSPAPTVVAGPGPTPPGGPVPPGGPFAPGGPVPPGGPIASGGPVPPADPNLPPGANPPAIPPAGGDQVVAAADADPPEARVLASGTGRGSARLNTVLSTRLTLLSPAPIDSPAPGPARRPEAGVAPAPGKISDLNAILRETPLEPPTGPSATINSPPPTPTSSPPAPGPAGSGGAGGPAPGATPAGLPGGRIFSILENVKASGARAVRVNVFLNHPNPSAATSTDDPHFVGTFGLFGLESHAAHGGMSVQLELTRTIARLRQANIAIGKELDVQLIPVEGRGKAPELMNPERIKIVTM
jgi:Common central domain of tyrosinase